MTFNHLLALLSAVGAVGITAAFLFLGVPIDRIAGIIIGGFILSAAFFTNPETVSGWIKAALDHLPGRKTPDG